MSFTRAWTRILWFLGGLLALAGPAPAAGPGDLCLECHGLAGLAIHGRSFWIDAGAFRQGVHGRLSCGDCHKNYGRFPHADGTRLRCDLPCHGAQDTHAPILERVSRSAHAGLGSPPCLGCHGATAPPEGPDALCRACHRGVEKPVVRYPDTPGAFGRRGHRRAGERAPGCTDCHGTHDAGPGRDARSRCSGGSCHPDAAPGFAALFDHGARSVPPPWGGAAPWVMWAGAALGVAALLHGTRRPR